MHSACKMGKQTIDENIRNRKWVKEKKKLCFWIEPYNSLKIWRYRTVYTSLDILLLGIGYFTHTGILSSFRIQNEQSILFECHSNEWERTFNKDCILHKYNIFCIQYIHHFVYSNVSNKLHLNGKKWKMMNSECYTDTDQRSNVSISNMFMTFSIFNQYIQNTEQYSPLNTYFVFWY